MIVLVVDHFGIGVDKPERDSPIAANPDSPCAFASAFERAKPKAGKAHIFGPGGGAEPTQDQPQSFSVLGLNPGPGSGCKELGQTFVLEASNHSP